MKKYFGFLVLITLIFTQVSCEKVIDLDFKDEQTKFVIEGTINKDSLVQTVKISRTLKFNETGAYPVIDNALVSVIDNLGNEATFTLVSPGVYQTINYLGVEGRTYTLTVKIEDEVFTSSSSMPFQVPIDSLTLEEFSFGPTPVFSLVANRIDPAGIKNYYLFNLYRNDTIVNGVFLQDDQFSDGKEILQPIFGGSYASGDTALLEMVCIDLRVYKYFYTLSVNAGGTGGAVPANPESNFGSDCLGYFSAQTKQKLQIIIP
jgi:hypothetical protein